MSLTLKYRNAAKFIFLGSNAMDLAELDDDVEGSPQCRVCMAPSEIPSISVPFACCNNLEAFEKYSLTIAAETHVNPAFGCGSAYCDGIEAQNPWILEYNAGIPAWRSDTYHHPTTPCGSETSSHFILECIAGLRLRLRLTLGNSTKGGEWLSAASIDCLGRIDMTWNGGAQVCDWGTHAPTVTLVPTL